MDKPKTTPKDFFLWLGAIVTFYWSVVAGILLIFDYINYSFPNPLAYLPSNPYQSGISYEMASVIVLLPLSLLLFWLIHRDATRDPSKNEIWVQRWGLLLTLFIAGAAIAGDLITLLTTFLNGKEITLAFSLKIIVVLLIAADVFLHFSAELRGYWDKFPVRRRVVTIGVAVAALAVIIAGFFIVGTPGQARAARFDMQKVSDLQSIQYQIVNYWQAKQHLPNALADLNNPISGFTVPTDPQTGAPYEYAVKWARGFELCATFNAPDRAGQNRYAVPALPTPAGDKPNTVHENWQHGAGRVCFDRSIDPELYPPLKR